MNKRKFAKAARQKIYTRLAKQAAEQPNTMFLGDGICNYLLAFCYGKLPPVTPFSVGMEHQDGCDAVYKTFPEVSLFTPWEGMKYGELWWGPGYRKQNPVPALVC